MYSVRNVKTKSGSVAVQVVQYVGHRSVIAKHIGSGKDGLEVTVLRQRAFEWIEEQTAQLSLFPFKNKRYWLLKGESALGLPIALHSSFL